VFSLLRLATRFLFTNFITNVESGDDAKALVTEHLSLVRKVLFSRSLRLLPLSQQVGVVEGLAILLQQLPGVLDITDQHVLAFLSELLKMSSVADGEMNDDLLKDFVVDKNGYAAFSPIKASQRYPTHSSALFFRRTCALEVGKFSIVLPEELPVGVQLRVSTIVLLHSVIRGYPDTFFDSAPSKPVGKVFGIVFQLFFNQCSNPLTKSSTNVSQAISGLMLSVSFSVLLRRSRQRPFRLLTRP